MLRLTIPVLVIDVTWGMAPDLWSSPVGVFCLAVGAGLTGTLRKYLLPCCGACTFCIGTPLCSVGAVVGLYPCTLGTVYLVKGARYLLLGVTVGACIVERLARLAGEGIRRGVRGDGGGWEGVLLLMLGTLDAGGWFGARWMNWPNLYTPGWLADACCSSFFFLQKWCGN